jgi:DNA-binding beta-propeller fold protein YncE
MSKHVSLAGFAAKLLAALSLCLACTAGVQAAGVISLGTYASVVGSAAGSGSEVVAASSSWTASSNASWIHLNTSSGTASAVATFSYDANPGTTRIGTVAFTSSADTVVLTVNQAGVTFVPQSQVATLASASSGLNNPEGVAVDGAGNVYIADTLNGKVKEWNAAQGVTTLPISGLSYPTGLTVDGAGNVYIADTENNLIKEWNVATQTVSTLPIGLNVPTGVAVDGAGNVYGLSSGGSKTIQELNAMTQQVTTLPFSGLTDPEAVAVDAAGNVYVADYGNNAIYELNAATQTMSTLIASGLSSPYGVAVDGAGNVYIADYGDQKTKEWNAVTQQLTTLPVSSGSNGPQGVAVDAAANVYVADTGDSAIKRYSLGFVGLAEASQILGPAAGSSSVVLATLPVDEALPWTATTSASWIHLTAASGITPASAPFTYDANTGATRTGTITFNGGSATLTVTQAGATFVAAESQVTTLVPSGQLTPFGVAVDGVGNVYIADYENNAIKEWNAATQQVTTLVSSGLNSPQGVAVDGAGNVYIADTQNFAVKEWNAATGQVTTLVPSGQLTPYGVAVDGVGNVYIADSGNSAIKEWHAETQQVTTLVSSGLNAPQGVAVDGAGNVYIADTLDYSVKKLSLGFVGLAETNQVLGPAAGSSSVVLATLPVGEALPWTAASSASWIHLTAASGRTAASAQFSYDADTGVTRTGTITFNGGATLTLTQAGTGYAAGNAVAALVSSGLSNPYGVAVDGAGNVYFSDTGNNAVKKWNAATLQVTTLVSTGLNSPEGVAVDGAGNIYIADWGSSTIKEWNAAAQQLSTLVSGLNHPIGVAVDAAGNVYIADTGNNAIEEWHTATQQLTTLVSGGLSNPTGVAVDGAGNVYIADLSNNAIKEWNAASQQVTTLVSSGLNGPYGVAVDAAGNVYIADSGNNAVKEWNAATQQMSTLVSSGLNGPISVAVDGTGNVYIADTGNSAIKEYSPGFIGPASFSESSAAGTDHLLPVLPTSTPLQATSDQTWLTIGSVVNGVLSFSFTANTTASARVAHITVLGRSITVTQAAPSPAAGLTPSGLTFALQTVGVTSAAQTIKLSNTGTVALSLSSIAISGTNAADYAQTNNCGASVAGGASCTISVTFKPGAASSRTATLTVTDNSGNVSGSKQTAALTGTGTASNTPGAVSLSPASGTGSTQIFTAVYSDSSGFASLTTVRFLINTGISAANGCYLQYLPAQNTMYLENNAGNASATLTPGSATAVSNSQCTLAGIGTTVSNSGNNLTITLALSFTSTFTAQQNLYLLAGNASASTGWVQKGTWTPGTVTTPGVVALSPASGSGSTQTFTAVYSDPKGYADLATVRLLINTAISAANGCYVQYSPAQNTLYLENNAGNGSATLTPGSAASVSNSQCTLAGTGTIVNTSGTDMTITFALSFTNTFTAQQNVYLLAGSASASTGWVQKGTWTPGTGTTPGIVALSPNSGSGSTQTFTAVYSDPKGYADLATLRLLINTAISAANGCYVQYSPAQNTLYLENNAGNASATLTPGAPTSVSNNQCTLSGIGSTVNTSGTDMTITFALSFTNTFTAKQNLYLLAGDNAASTGWVLSGSWTP